MQKNPAVLHQMVGKWLPGIFFSLLGAGIAYSAWLALFLLALRLNSPITQSVLWLLSPVITAAGFALGLVLFEHVTGNVRTGFSGIFLWPLLGCVIGAGVVYWFGPMLIVFGMFAVGTVSVTLREVIRLMRDETFSRALRRNGGARDVPARDSNSDAGSV